MTLGQISGRAGRPGAPTRVSQDNAAELTSEERLRSLGQEIDKTTTESQTVANHAGLTALGDEMKNVSPPKKGGRHSAHGHSRKKRRVRRIVLISLVVLLILVGGGAGYLYYLTHDLNRVEVRGLAGALTTGQEAGTENILMVGSTSRCALAVAEPRVRPLLARCERSQQRRHHDPARRSEPPPAGAPVDPT